MQALMKALLAAGSKGKNLAGQIGNLGKGSMEIAKGGAAPLAAGGKSEALKKLLLANKGGAAALGGAGAAGLGGAGYAAMGDDDDEDEILERLGIGR
jgi:hypothetical protein